MSYELQPVHGYVTAYHTRTKARRRRAMLTAALLCLNGPAHGRATRGRRCAHCHAVHRYGKQTMAARPAWIRVDLLSSELRLIAHA